MSDASTVAVKIGGREFRIKTDEDAESLQKVAGYLDDTIKGVAERTGTIDSLDVVTLTALNLAREVVRQRGEGGAAAPTRRLRALTDRVEAALADTGDDSA